MRWLSRTDDTGATAERNFALVTRERTSGGIWVGTVGTS
jgi:hypothetical protein